MIPILISIEGFYSYQSKQTVDFEKLSKAGLFGIFGATGSGKSAIIEAMIFALYGKSERLNNQDLQAYNMMNLRSNQFYIEFICYSDYTKSNYKITVFAKRGKQFEKVSTIEHNYYKEINGSWTPIHENLIETEVTGLSYSNFIQTVIIPQGKFMEFLQLKQTARTTMLKDLFKLHTFEMSEQVKFLENAALQNRANIEGKLQEIGEVSEQEILTLENRKKEIETTELSMVEAHKSHSKTLKQLDILQEKHINLDKLVAIKNTLIEDSEKYIKIEELITKIDYCNKHFSSIIESLQAKEIDIVKIEQNLITLKTELSKANIVFEEVSKEFELKSKDFQSITKVSNEILDLKKLADCTLIEKDISNKKTECLQFSNQISDIKSKKLQIEEQINLLKKNKTKLQEEKGNISDLLQLKSEYEKYKTICLSLENTRKERIEIENNTKLISEEIIAIVKPLGITSREYSLIEKEIQKNIHLIENSILDIENKIYSSKIHQEITVLQENLKQGQDCPVCGSKDHAENLPFHAKNETDIDLQVFKKTQQEQLKQIIEAKKSIEIKNQNIKDIKKKDEILGTNMHKLTIERNLNEPDSKINYEEILNKITVFTQIDEKIKQIDIQITKHTNDLNSLISNNEQSENQLKTLNNQLLESQTKYNTLYTQISNEIISEYKTKSHHEIEQDIKTKESFITKTNKDFNEISQRFEKGKDYITNHKNKIELTESQLIDKREELGILNENILFAIYKSDFATKEEIIEILKQGPELLSLSQALEKYKYELSTTTKAILDIQDFIKDKTYSTEIHKDISKQYTSNENDLIKLREELTEIKQTIKLLKEKFDKNKLLLLQYNSIKHEIENIAVMKNLFKSNGFVNYMSTKYIEMICMIANTRFKKLTKYALSLEICDNSFCVRDYLNNGKIRNIKTLSGGQAFQAALSLALALSESVRYNSPILSNFFFIDEGFGSQDKESLEIVFETLRSIQNEGKIVGIISHVEELQENIPMYISVQNTEKGSVID